MTATARNGKFVADPARDRSRAIDSILAVDASGGACSAALWRAGTVVSSRFQAMSRGHAEALLPMMVETLAAASTSFHALGAIAVTVGPGAFTGLRIGLAGARGIALAVGIPAIGITTFDAVAQSVIADDRRGRTLRVFLDTKRRDVFVQSYTSDCAAMGSAAILSPAEAAGLCSSGATAIAGDGVALVRPHLRGDLQGIEVHSEGPVDAVHVARAAARLVATRRPLPPPCPLYLRAPDVTIAAGFGRDPAGPLS